MQEGETGNTVAKCHDRGTGIEAVLVYAPRLQRTTEHSKHHGCLTLGHSLDCQSAILRKEVCAFEALPVLVAIRVASLRVLDSCAHSGLLLQPFALVYVMA